MLEGLSSVWVGCSCRVWEMRDLLAWLFPRGCWDGAESPVAGSFAHRLLRTLPLQEDPVSP